MTPGTDPSARQVAAAVLVRVVSDEAYAAAALSSALSRSRLSSVDRALATEIVYGVLRTEPYLRRRLSKFGKLKSSDTKQLAHLLVAAYQIDLLDRVPARAAIYEAVEELRALRGEKVAGFGNAILRAVADSKTESGSTFEEAVLQSTPSWIRKRLQRDVGNEDAIALLAPSRAPRPHLRLTGVDTALEWLEEQCSPCVFVPRAYQYLGGGDPRRLFGYEEGKFVVQELGAQLVAHATGVQLGERVLDVCAGRGQKATLFAEQVGSEGTVVATDLHQHKLAALEAECSRLGLGVVRETWDWTRPPPVKWQGAFDRVLVDAPCTGLGTLRRRPEIARRLAPEDPSRLAELQGLILENAFKAVRPGGILVFATCSVLSEEAEQVVERVRERVGALEECLFETPADEALFPAQKSPSQGEPVEPGAGPTAHFRLLPRVHGTDGYFVARLRRA